MGMVDMPLGMKTGVLLIALALGYVVCYLAKREDKNLRTAGYVIGTFIIAASALLILGNLICGARFCRRKFPCLKNPMMMKGHMPAQMPMPGQAEQQ